jgi:hypothetical protein
MAVSTLYRHAGASADCRYRNDCSDLNCLEDAKCGAAPGAIMGPCQDVEVDLKQAGASCQNIAQSPPGCFFGCPEGMAMTGMYRTTTNNLLGITKFRCCQVLAIPLQVVTPVVSAPQGSAATMLLYPGQKLCSPTACAFYLRLEPDCNLVLYKTGGSSVWSTSTQGSLAPCSLAMESKGSLVLYDRAKALPQLRRA